MNNLVPFKRPIRWDKLRAEEAERIIRERALKSENVIFTDHFYERERDRDINQPDVFRILREGYVDDPPQKDKNGNWVATITRRIRGGRNAGVVSVINKETEEIIIVTVMWIDPK